MLQHRASETGPRGATLGRGNGQALEGAALMLRKMTYKNTRPKEKKETYCRNMKTKGGNHVSKTIEIYRTYIWKRLEP